MAVQAQWIAAWLGLALGAAQAAPVSDVLVRPALPTAAPARATLLGAARAGERLVAVGERGIVALSDDMGRSWRQASVPVSVSLTAVCFVDARNGFAVGHGGVVLASDDGGEHWRKLADGRVLAEVALKAAEASGNAAAVGEAQRLVAEGPDKPLLDLHFFDARHGLVVGAFNLAFATEDGGQTWQSLSERLDNPKALHLHALRAQGRVLLLVGEQGLVFRSEDQGRSFTRLPLPYAGSLFTAEMPSEDEIVVAGLRGNAWRSVDRGASWTHVDAMPVTFTGSSLQTDRRVLLANQAGLLFTLQGNRLVSLPGGAAAPLNALLALPGNQVLALDAHGASLLAVAPTGGAR